MTEPTLSPAEQAQHYRLFLRELIVAGTELLRLFRVAIQPDKSPLPRQGRSLSILDSAIAYERMSRAIRRGIILAQRVAMPTPAAARNRAMVRRRIIREVEDAIYRVSTSEGQEQRLQAKLSERLDSSELEDEIHDNRPPAEIIADICRDLGLAARSIGLGAWKRRTAADITRLCARAAHEPEAQLAAVPPSAAPPAPPAKRARPRKDFLRLVPTPGEG